jgi:hypothetical protein
MPISVHFVLMLIAIICLFCAAIGRPATSPISLGWLGLFFWALDLLIAGVPR